MPSGVSRAPISAAIPSTGRSNHSDGLAVFSTVTITSDGVLSTSSGLILPPSSSVILTVLWKDTS